MLRRAFTAVELLVVVGIIAVLTAILLPALSRAREMSKSIKCLSNLRQMGILADMYINANSGFYPVAIWTHSDGSQDGWDFSYDVAGTPGPGLIWQIRSGGIEIQQCPSFEGNSSTPNDPYTGYNYNTSGIGHGSGESPTEQPVKAVSVTHSPGCALFGDGAFSTNDADKYMRCPQTTLGDLPADPLTRIYGTQGYRHLGRTNVVYCDGHGESVSDRFTQSVGGTAAPGTGFLSADDSAYTP